MALESVTTIYDLNASNPTSGDPKSQGDDHLRNLKTGILASFAYTAASNGCQRIGKAIIFWGNVTVLATNSDTTFNLTFPSGVTSVTAVAVSIIPNSVGIVGGTVCVVDSWPKAAATSVVFRSSVTGNHVVVVIGYP